MNSHFSAGKTGLGRVLTKSGGRYNFDPAPSVLALALGRMGRGRQSIAGVLHRGSWVNGESQG